MSVGWTASWSIHAAMCCIFPVDDKNWGSAWGSQHESLWPTLGNSCQVKRDWTHSRPFVASKSLSLSRSLLALWLVSDPLRLRWASSVRWQMWRSSLALMLIGETFGTMAPGFGMRCWTCRSPSYSRNIIVGAGNIIAGAGLATRTVVQCDLCCRTGIGGW